MRRKMYLDVQCAICGLIGSSDEVRDDGQWVLQIDHIDGNVRNNNIENIQTLCCDCNFIKGAIMKDGYRADLVFHWLENSGHLPSIIGDIV